MRFIDGRPTMFESLFVYAAWAALIAAVITSVVIVQGAIRQLLQDSAEGHAEAHDPSTHLDSPTVHPRA